MRVAVRFNGGPVWSAIDAGAFTFATNIVPGDVIDFAVYGGFGGGATPVDVQIRVAQSYANCSVTVLDTRGDADPTNGTYSVAYGTVLNAHVPAIVTDGSIRHICTGASVDGTTFTQDPVNQVSLTVTNDATLIWDWSSEHLLATAVEGNGTITGEGWYAAGTCVVLSASPAAGFRFSSWSDGELSLSRTVTVPNGGATYTALFSPLPRGMVRFQKAAFSAKEDDSFVKLTVERIDGSYGEATVHCGATDESAESGEDYLFEPTTLYWADGASGAKSIYVELLDDSSCEGAESFTVVLSDATGASIGTPSSAPVTILDNEPGTTVTPRFSESLDFGNVATNATSTQIVELWNDGNAPLLVTNITVTACFSVTQQVITVAAGASVCIAVTFAPVEVTAYAGQLTLGCNATSGSPSLSLSGIGIEPVTTCGTRTIMGRTALITVEVPAGASVLGVEDELGQALIPLTISDGGTWDPLSRKVKWFFNEPGQIRSRTLQYTVDTDGSVVSGAVNFGSGNQPIGGDTEFVGDAVPMLLHPADNNGDWRIVLDEASACVARWRNGIDDYKTPVVVRGITLYLQGERYTFDPSVSAEAKRWIPVIPSAAAGTPSADPIAMTMQSSPYSGAVRIADSTNVTITVTPEANTLAWGLDEAVAQDVQIGAISHNGTWDATHRKIKWLFPDGTPRTVSYSISGEAGTTASVEGIASFDGSESPVAGTATVAVPLPFLTWAERRGLSGTQDALFLATDVQSGQPNALAYAFSPNLTSNTPLLGVRWTGGVPLIDTPVPNPAAAPFVEVLVVGKTDLSTAGWPITLLPVSTAAHAETNRYFWTLPTPLPQCFFKVRVVPK